MNLPCPDCDHPNWVGLRFCTRCGLRQTGFAARPAHAAELSPIFRSHIDAWTLDEAADLYPVFGELVFIDGKGQAWILSPEPQARPRPLGLSQNAGPVEVLAVDRWLVVREGDQIRVLASPLIRTARLNNLPVLTTQAMPSGTAARLEGARATLWRAKVGSIARIGTHLAVLVEVDGTTRLRVFSLAGSEDRRWEAQATVLRDDPLPAGTWHFERGATPRGVALVAASDRAVVLLRESRQHAPKLERLVFELPPHAGWLRAGSATLTSYGIAVLTEANDALLPWLLHDPEARPLAIIAPEALDGLEPQVQGETVTVMARARGQRHQLNFLVPRFEVDPIAGAVTNRIEEELPGGVLYRANDWTSLWLRSPAEDTALPLENEPRGSTVRGALEGRRLWVLSRREGRPGCSVTALEWEA